MVIYGMVIHGDEAEEGIKIAGRIMNNLRYADDTTLLAGKKKDLVELIRRLKSESEKAGLYFNIKKTKIMTTEAEESFEIDGEEIETVTSFTFLGSLIEKEGKCDMEINRRVAIGKATMNGLEKIWKDKHVSIDTKKRLVKALIIPTITYGSETWTMTKKMEKRLTHAKCTYGGRCREYHGSRKGPTTRCAWTLELRR